MESKRVFGMLIISLVFYLGTSLVLAEVLEDIDGTKSVEIEEAGITPDSSFYWADSFGESFRLAMTFNKDKEIKLRLRYAEEKLSEANEMAKEGKVAELKKSQRKHLKNLERAKESFDKLEFKDEVEEFDKEIEFESELQSHERKIEAVEQNIKLKIKGDLTEEQLGLIEKLMASFRDDAGKLKIEIKNKKGKTKVKIEQKGLDADEFEDEFEKKHGNKATLEDLLEKIEDAKEQISEAEVEIEKAKTEGKETEASEKRLDDARFKLEQAEEMIEKENYQSAYSLAKNAEKFAKQARMKFIGKSLEDANEEDDSDDVFSDAASNSNDEDDEDEDDEDDEDNSGQGNNGDNSESGNSN